MSLPSTKRHTSRLNHSGLKNTVTDETSTDISVVAKVVVELVAEDIDSQSPEESLVLSTDQIQVADSNVGGLQSQNPNNRISKEADNFHRDNFKVSRLSATLSNSLLWSCAFHLLIIGVIWHMCPISQHNFYRDTNHVTVEWSSVVNNSPMKEQPRTHEGDGTAKPSVPNRIASEAIAKQIQVADRAHLSKILTRPKRALMRVLPAISTDNLRKPTLAPTSHSMPGEPILNKVPEPPLIVESSPSKVPAPQTEPISPKEPSSEAAANIMPVSKLTSAWETSASPPVQTKTVSVSAASTTPVRGRKSAGPDSNFGQEPFTWQFQGDKSTMGGRGWHHGPDGEFILDHIEKNEQFDEHNEAASESMEAAQFCETRAQSARIRGNVAEYEHWHKLAAKPLEKELAELQTYLPRVEKRDKSDSAHTYENIAFCYAMLGDSRRAQAAYKEYELRRADYWAAPYGHYSLASIFMVRGQLEEAKQLLQRTVSGSGRDQWNQANTDPEYRVISWELIAHIEALQGNATASLAAREEAIKVVRPIANRPVQNGGGTQTSLQWVIERLKGIGIYTDISQSVNPITY